MTMITRVSPAIDLYRQKEIFDLGEEELFDPGEEEIFDSAAREEEAITEEDEDSSNAAIIGLTQIALDKGKPVDDRLDALLNIFFLKDRELQAEKQKNVDLNHKFVQLQNNFVREKVIYDEKTEELQADLNKTKTGLEKTKADLDEASVTTIREEWIKKNIDLEGAYIAGTTLGMATSVMGIMGAMALGVTNPPVLPLMALGAYKGPMILRESHEKGLREELKRFEKEYLKKNPTASKKDAFEYAKDQFQQARENANSDDYDGTTPDISY